MKIIRWLCVGYSGVITCFVAFMAFGLDTFFGVLVFIVGIITLGESVFAGLDNGKGD